MTTYPVYDLLVKSDSGSEEYGYFVYTKSESPLGVGIKRGTLSAYVADTPGQSGGAYSVRDQDQPAFIIGDFTGGAGQNSYETEGSLTNRFHSSFCIDTAKKGEMRLAKASALTANTACQGLMFPALGTVFQSYSPTGVTHDQNSTKYWTGSAFSAVPYTNDDPTQDVNCYATDGEYLYIGVGSDGVWRVKDSDADGSFADELATQWSTEAGIFKMCFSGGYMYGAKGGSVGFWDVGPVWNQISPTAPIDPSLTTFGLVPANNWVYWGVTKDGYTKLYRVQYDGTAESFEDFAEFPTGFVGTCMASYLGNVFIGGYYECAASDSGQGAIYLVSDSVTTLLTVIGENPDYEEDPGSNDNDNRIWSMHPYGKDLFLLATRKVLRWDLDGGGWTHVMDVPQGSLTSLVWQSSGDLQYVGDHLPIATTWSPGGGAVAAGLAGGSLVLGSLANHAGSKTYTHSAITALSTSTGTTMEVTVPAYSIGGNDGAATQVFGFDDGTDEAIVQVTKWSSTQLRIMLPSYDGSLISSVSVWYADVSVPHTYRLTLRYGTARLYCDGVYLGQTSDCKTSTDERVYFGSTHLSTVIGSTARYESVSISSSGAYAPGAEYAPAAGGSLAILDNKLFVGLTDVGYVTSSSTYETSGWLRSSVSASRSGSMEKTYHSIIVDHKTLSASESLACDCYIDGVFVGLTDGVTTATRTVFDVGLTGHSIAPVLTLASTAGASTPIVYAITVTYDFSKYKLHNYVLDCRAGAGNGHWDYDPEKAIEHLFTVASNGGTFESRFSPAYQGEIQTCDFVQAQRSSRDTLEGIIQLVVREVE